MKSIQAVFASIMISAFAVCFAYAGTPTSVLNATGTTTYPTDPALSIEKDTSSGNRVKVKYSSGYQYVADDAAWTRYAALKAGLTKPVDSPTSVTGLSYDIAKAFTGCNNGQSYVAWPNVGNPEYVDDKCAFANSAKSESK